MAGCAYLSLRYMGAPAAITDLVSLLFYCRAAQAW